jgi:hypothetical protein
MVSVKKIKCNNWYTLHISIYSLMIPTEMASLPCETFPVAEYILSFFSYELSQKWGYWGEGGGRGAELILRSWQLSRKKRVGGGGLLAWPTTADSPHSTDNNGNSYFQLDT